MDTTLLWQTLLDQLQHDLPRASFETWLRDTHVHSRKADTLHIVARDVYARDWLQSRMTEDICTRLQTLTGEALQVAFVLEQEEAFVEEEETETQECFTAEMVDETEYQSEVHPERVVLFEGYTLRYLEHGETSPKQLSIWAALGIPVYRLHKQGKETVRNIPYWEVLRFANMSKASFFRETTSRDEFAGGLVEVVPTPGELTYDRRFDHARRYRIHLNPRLTRRDCAVLQAILHREICLATSQEEALQIARRTLQGLQDGEPGQYLEQFPKIEAKEKQLRSLPEIVRHVLDLQEKLPEDLNKLAERVTNRILRGFGKVLVTHYFLQNATRKYHLTHPQIWAIIALRDRCWYDHETRSQKEFALVRGGLSEVGSWVGVDLRTVRRWLKDPGFASFVQLSDAATLKLDAAWVGKRTVFWVRQEEPRERGQEWDKVSTEARQSEYRPGTKCDMGRDKVSNEVGQSEYLLNNLIQPQDSPKDPQEYPPANARAGNKAFWELDFLFENNRVQPQSRKHLLASNKVWGRGIKSLSEGFVSWLLYAYSPDGNRVRDPVGLAIRRLQENAHAGAGGNFDRLAKLTPYKLRALFEADINGQDLGVSPEADLFRLNFSALLSEHKKDLFWRLFGSAS